MTKQQQRKGPARGAEHNRRCIERARAKAAEGRVAVFHADVRAFLVPSTTTGAVYHVTVEGVPSGHTAASQVGPVVRVRCDCEAGRQQPPLGDTACWHGAAGALAMAERGLVQFDGARWKLGAGPVVASDAELHERSVSALVD